MLNILNENAILGEQLDEKINILNNEVERLRDGD